MDIHGSDFQNETSARLMRQQQAVDNDSTKDSVAQIAKNKVRAVRRQ